MTLPDLGDELGRLIYLVILLGALGFYFLIANRRNLGRLLRHAVLWALLFIAVLASYGLWQDVSPRLAPAQITRGSGIIEVPRDRSGHYVLMAKVNGHAIEFLVDTGASNIVLSRKDAERAGVDLDELMFTGNAKTANGEVRTARVRINALDIGGVVDENVRAYVTDGDLFGSLLGMDYLQRYEKIEIQRDKLVLTR